MLKLRSGPLLGVSGIAGIAALIVLGISGAAVEAQTADALPMAQIPEWQKAAGGQLSFEVASVKLGNPATFTPPNFPLDFLDSFSGASPHGRLVAEFPLEIYIAFAYKLFPYLKDQKEVMLAHSPKWVSADKYAINALAEGDPTKDQMRLMMQSLLADRFKVAVHFEQQEVSVLALVLASPGKTGTKLYPHSNGPPCDLPGVSLLSVCNTIWAIPKADNVIVLGARNVSMAQIAGGLSATGQLARPLIDQTGLIEPFDFTLEFTRESNAPLSGPGVQPDSPGTTFQGTTFQQALQEQLGLRLKSTKVLMDTLVVDRVERPSEN